MNKKATLLFALLIIIGLCFAGTHDPWDGTKWDVASPDIDQPHGNAYKEIYDLRKGVAVRINKEHETLATSSAGGVHKQGSARAFFQDAAPTTQVDGSAFDSGDLGSFWFDTNSTPDNQFNVLTATTPTWTPISTEIIAVLLASNRTFAGTLTVTGESTFNNHINLGAGDDLIGSSTSDITINTNKFTVAGATGNTVVAGTLGVTGASTFTAGITANGGVTLGAGDDLIGSSTSDITINTNKFTVAGATGNTVVAGTLSVAGAATFPGGVFSAYATDDTDSQTLAAAHAYLAGTDGFVMALEDMSTADSDLIGYVGATDDPAGAGTIIQHEEAGATNKIVSISFPVQSGAYFEITSTEGSPTILWMSIGTLVKPADQD